jgi:membrane associated rhomboid family serine protease
VSSISTLNPFARFVLRLTDKDVGGRLLDWQGPQAHVRLPEGTLIFAIAVGAGETPRVEAFASRLASQGVSGKVVVIGGDAELIAFIDRVGVMGKLAILCFDRRGQLRAGSPGLVGKALSEASEHLARPETVETSPAEIERKIQGRIASTRQEIEEVERYRNALAERRPWFTYALLGVLVVLFLLDGVVRLPNGIGLLSSVGALRVQGDPAFSWAQLLGYSFFHGGIVHIAMNGYALYLLGTFLERLVGTTRLIVIYTVSCLGGGVAVWLLQGQGVTVGASGGIWGLMTAMAVLFFRPQGIVPEVMVAPMRRSFGQILVLNLMLSFLPGISLWGHLGGGLGGAVLMGSGLVALGVPKADEARDPNAVQNTASRLWVGAAVLSAVAMAASMAVVCWLALSLLVYAT